MLRLAPLIKSKQLTIAVAESCTGGLLSSTLTDTDGASAWFIGGVIAYDRSAKQRLLDICWDWDLETMSRDCARKMNLALKTRLEADIYCSVVGMIESHVWIHVIHPGGQTTRRLEMPPGAEDMTSVTRMVNKRIVVNEVLLILEDVLSSD